MHRAKRKGQFTVLTAGAITVILVVAVIATFAAIRNNSVRNPTNVADAVNEMNLALQRVMESTVGYYGSILQVSGNASFAKSQASAYFSSGLVQIGLTHPDWAPTINVKTSSISLNWFAPASSSSGSLAATYSLNALGTFNVSFTDNPQLQVTILTPVQGGTARVQILQDGNIPDLGLSLSNFKFYAYAFGNSSWNVVPIPSIPVAYANGTYDVSIPSGVDPSAYVIQVSDGRGIITTASKLSKYSYTMTWNNLYSSLSQDTMMVELLQNGTMRWLGQNLVVTGQARPIPPLAVRALRINETIGGFNQQVPFQIEDWASNYRVAVGMSNPQTLFSSRNMLVFLMTHSVQAVTVWWDGRDIANQTSYASQNRYFTGDNPGSGTLTNGQLTLSIGSFAITATTSTSTTTANFMRINGQASVYGSSAAYVVHHGIVRDVLQQEAEWSNGAPNVPNAYSNMIILFPANATYYAYSLRAIFVASAQSRVLTDLSMLQLSVGSGSARTENGTSAGLPISSSATGNFWDQSWGGFPTGWMHHWSEYVTGGNGGGIMMTDTGNRNLYPFDSIAGGKTGAINVASSGRVIELDPVRLRQASFTFALDVTLIGAAVTFNGTPLYPTSGSTGLWIMVEYPPTVAVS